jgi:hypothetical protein
MPVAILIEFKEPSREKLYLPLAAQGAYSGEWLPAAQELGLSGIPHPAETFAHRYLQASHRQLARE